MPGKKHSKSHDQWCIKCTALRPMQIHCICIESSVPDGMLFKMQVLSEMIISNESNILTSRVLSHFNRSRQLLFTIKLRYKDLEKVWHHCT